MLQRLSLLLLLIPFLSIAQNEGPRPTWVKLAEAPAPNEAWRDNGLQYLAYDHQYNVASNESFFRHTYLLESPEAVSSYSNLSVSYHPSFRSLTFHNIFIIRDGKRIDLLESHVADLIRTESSRSRLIYDSSMSMVYNLRDIRPGDILQYEYSLKGSNPAFKDHYYSSESLQRYLPLGYLNYRILIPKGEYPEFIYDGPEVVEPKEVKHESYDEFIWLLEDVPAAEFEEGEPSNYDPRPRVAISNYHSWAQLLQDALALYQLPRLETAAVKQAALEIIGEEKDPEKQLQLLTEFVQDQVRYLGFENGVHAFKPHNPVNVLDQRYGDCKDKSLLLVALMRSLGTEAYPMWVSTYKNRNLRQDEVSPYVFNHCVMLAIHEGDTIYIDPTSSSMGGPFKDQNFPNYGKGLILKPGQKHLKPLPQGLQGSITIHDTYVVAENNSSSSSLEVSTIYKGDEADNIRHYLTNNTPESISEDYLSYYESLWPSIRMAELPEIKDDRAANIITVKERYKIDSIWEPEEDVYRAYFYAEGIRDFFRYADNPNRTAPQSLTYPKDFTYEIDLFLPEDWPVENENFSIVQPEYRYDYLARASSNKEHYNIKHHYQVLAPEIAAEDYQRFVRDHDKMSDNAGYNISFHSDDFGSSGGDPSNNKVLMNILIWIVRFISLVVAVIALYLLDRYYDPLPAMEHITKEKMRIGGWMVLPLLGLIASPFVMIYSLVDAWTPEMLNNLSYMLSSKDDPDGVSYVVFVLFEHFIDIFQLAFAFLLLLQFFKYRSSLPKLMVAWYVFGLLWELILYAGMVNFELTSSYTAGKELYRPFLATFIWGTYFLVNTRVKQTFVVSRKRPAYADEVRAAQALAKEKQALRMSDTNANTEGNP